MESDQTKSSSVFSSLPLKIGMVVVGVILIAGGLYRIFGGSGTKVSDAFIGKFNEIHVVLGGIRSDLQTVGNVLAGIATKEQAKDYQGAVRDLDTGLEKLADITTKAKELEPKAAEFKAMVDAVGDPAIKDSGLKFVDLVGQIRAISLELADDGKQFVTPAKGYYEGLASGKAVSLPEVQFTALAKKMNNDVETLVKLARQFDTATRGLAKAANFQIKPIKK